MSLPHPTSSDHPAVAVPLADLELLLESVDMNALSKRMALKMATELMDEMRFRCRLVKSKYT